MKILYTKKENGNFRVDFKEPPCVTSEQLDEIKQLLKNIGMEYEIRTVEEKAKEAAEYLLRENKVWTLDQKMLLFDVHAGDEGIAAKTGHSTFGVRMKRGEILSEYAVWCKENKLNPADEKNRKKFLGVD